MGVHFVDEAANALLGAYASRTALPPLAVTYPGLSASDAYAIQLAQVAAWTAEGAVVKGHKVSGHVSAMVVPGSGQVKKEAEAEGLDKIFKAAGFEWREAGCSMCLAMNPDKLEPGERCASTSNRNFEGRQGKGGRTHLVSPAMAAAAAVAGHFVDVREWDYKA